MGARRKVNAKTSNCGLWSRAIVLVCIAGIAVSSLAGCARPSTAVRTEVYGVLGGDANGYFIVDKIGDPMKVSASALSLLAREPGASIHGVVVRMHGGGFRTELTPGWYFFIYGLCVLSPRFAKYSSGRHDLGQNRIFYVGHAPVHLTFSCFAPTM